jgi:hypothetical protein
VGMGKGGGEKFFRGVTAFVRLMVDLPNKALANC